MKLTALLHPPKKNYHNTHTEKARESREGEASTSLCITSSCLFMSHLIMLWHLHIHLTVCQAICRWKYFPAFVDAVEQKNQNNQKENREQKAECCCYFIANKIPQQNFGWKWRQVRLVDRLVGWSVCPSSHSINTIYEFVCFVSSFFIVWRNGL